MSGELNVMILKVRRVVDALGRFRDVPALLECPRCAGPLHALARDPQEGVLVTDASIRTGVVPVDLCKCRAHGLLAAVADGELVRARARVRSPRYLGVGKDKRATDLAFLNDASQSGASHE